MTNMPLQVVVLCGGQSVEHEISLRSTCFILEALRKEACYHISLLFIDQQGRWFHLKQYERFFQQNWKQYLEPIYLVPGDPQTPFRTLSKHVPIDVDIVFPVLHGTKGEDGIQQGLLEALNMPYVGADVLGSSICMNKAVTKRLLRDAGIAVVDWVSVHAHEIDNLDSEHIVQELGLPLIIKPASLGSSVGVSKVNIIADLIPAVRKALLYDTHVIIEKFIQGRELECAVLGTDGEPKASNIGEVIPINHEFYSYCAKYLDEHGAKIKTSIDLPAKISHSIQRIAIKTVQVLHCSEMARVDFFLNKDHKIFVNEVNTIPGFTSISMYPKLWNVSGIDSSQLIKKLIQISLDKFKHKSALLHEYNELHKYDE